MISSQSVSLCDNYDKLNQEKEMLEVRVKQLEQEKGKYNSLLFIVTMIYAAIWAGIFFFAREGIAIFSEAFNKPLQMQIILYSVLACIIAPSVGSVIYNCYYSSRDVEKKDYCVELECEDINTGGGLTQWFTERWKYHTQSEVMRKHVMCWSAHAFSITAYSGVYYLAIRGIISLVKENFPQPEWHNTIIIALSIATFVALAVIDMVFYHSIQSMAWYDAPKINYTNNSTIALNDDGMTARR